MRYPGGKGGSGVYQAIINELPPHRVYIEPFAGGANVWERKAPAASSILMDLDPAAVVAMLDRHSARMNATNSTMLQGDAFDFLRSYAWQGDELVYLDPPYLHSTRRDRSLYRCELTDLQHRQLLDLVASLPVPVALSGYRSAMYDDASSRHGWRRIDFNAMTRRGVALESLWLTFPPPSTIAEFTYVGSDFRERERIKRKVTRWVQRWQQLPELERQAIKAAMLATTASADDVRRHASPRQAVAADIAS